MQPSILSDIPYLYLFWLIIFSIGVFNLPLTLRLFNTFGDKGYIFSKILGLILISYTVWLLSSLRIAPFNLVNSIVVFVLWALFNLVLLIKSIKKEKKFIQSLPIKLWIFEELLFTFIFVGWSLVRGYNPEIHGLEKFMDFGFINSLLRTSYMPPLDMWLSSSNNPGLYTGSFTINYYYFGHFVTSLLTKLSTVPASVTYNLMLGLLCAFTFMGSFSLTSNLFYIFSKKIKDIEFLSKKVILSGILGGLLVAFGGNLHTIYAFTKGYDFDTPKPVWEVLGKPNVSRYWYPNATRFIPNTIHEFPLYSFVVSDLHGHVLDIPFVLFTLAFLFSIAISVKNSEKLHGNTIASFISSIQSTVSFQKIILLGLVISVMYMTNAWDGIIYFGLSVLVFMVLFTTLDDNKNYSISLFPTFRIHLLSKNISLYLPRFLLIVFTLGISYLLFSLPFNMHFVPFAKGIGVNCVTPNSSNQILCDFSPWWMLLILWGYFYFFALTFLITTIFPAFKRMFTHSETSGLTQSDVFATILIIISTGLLIAPELIFARDIYPAHYRANTMFKLGYQAFMMLGIASSFIIFRFVEHSPFKKIKNKFSLLAKIWWKFAFLILFLVLLYPFFATNSYYNGLKMYQGLDGLTWLWRVHPGDLATIEFFKETLGEKEQPVILEAVGQSYTDYARISANTGLPTVLGWPVHEWLWRGSFDESGKREREVKEIYEAKDKDSAKKLLDTFNVEYVIVGKLEKDQYHNLNESIFYELGTVVFEAGNTKVFQIR